MDEAPEQPPSSADAVREEPGEPSLADAGVCSCCSTRCATWSASDCRSRCIGSGCVCGPPDDIEALDQEPADTADAGAARATAQSEGAG